LSFLDSPQITCHIKKKKKIRRKDWGLIVLCPRYSVNKTLGVLLPFYLLFLLEHKTLFLFLSSIILHPPHLQLHSTAMQLAADLLKHHADHVVLKALKLIGVEGNLETLAEYACKLSEQKEQLIEVSNRFSC
jgi:hypothetical protein